MIDIKKTVLLILIAILFTSISFYAANVFFNQPENTCWNKNITDKNTTQKEVNTCNQIYEKNENSNKKNKLIFISIINILIIAFTIFLIFDIITQGLFYGSILSSIIANISYYDSASAIGLILAIIVLVEIIILIKRRLN